PNDNRSFNCSSWSILPSSITSVLSLTYGFSPRLPVSVCSTCTCNLARGFSWQCGFGNFGTLFPSPSQLGIIGRICLSNFLTAWTHTSSGAHFLSDCVSPSLERSRGGAGISTCLPSPTP